MLFLPSYNEARNQIIPRSSSGVVVVEATGGAGQAPSFSWHLPIQLEGIVPQQLYAEMIFEINDALEAQKLGSIYDCYSCCGLFGGASSIESICNRWSETLKSTGTHITIKQKLMRVKRTEVDFVERTVIYNHPFTWMLLRLPANQRTAMEKKEEFALSKISSNTKLNECVDVSPGGATAPFPPVTSQPTDSPSIPTFNWEKSNPKPKIVAKSLMRSVTVADKSKLAPGATLRKAASVGDCRQSEHAFYVHTFNRPTDCMACSKMLMGVSKQGVRCYLCGYHCHRQCAGFLQHLIGCPVKARMNTATPHEFQSHTYLTPTNCAACSKLLVGIASQGFKCKACHVDVHTNEACTGAVADNCPGVPPDSQALHMYLSTKLDEVRRLHVMALEGDSGCDASEEELGDHIVQGSGPHQFSKKNYKTPTYCHVCNSLLVGLVKQGLRCHICKMDVHDRCMTIAQSEHNCAPASMPSMNPGGHVLVDIDQSDIGKPCTMCNQPIAVHAFKCSGCEVVTHNLDECLRKAEIWQCAARSAYSPAYLKPASPTISGYTGPRRSSEPPRSPMLERLRGAIKPTKSAELMGMAQISLDVMDSAGIGSEANRIANRRRMSASIVLDQPTDFGGSAPLGTTGSLSGPLTMGRTSSDPPKLRARNNALHSTNSLSVISEPQGRNGSGGLSPIMASPRGGSFLGDSAPKSPKRLAQRRKSFSSAPLDMDEFKNDSTDEFAKAPAARMKSTGRIDEPKADLTSGSMVSPLSAQTHTHTQTQTQENTDTPTPPSDTSANTLMRRRSSANQDGSASPEKNVVAVGDHEFVIFTYGGPTKCAVCTKLLIGLRNQGMRCGKCFMDIHSTCMDHVTHTCSPDGNEMVALGPDGNASSLGQRFSSGLQRSVRRSGSKDNKPSRRLSSLV